MVTHAVFYRFVDSSWCNHCLCAGGYMVWRVCVCTLKVIRATEQTQLPLFRQSTRCSPATVFFNTNTICVRVRKLNPPKRVPDGPVCVWRKCLHAQYFFILVRGRERDEVTPLCIIMAEKWLSSNTDFKHGSGVPMCSSVQFIPPDAHMILRDDCPSQFLVW